MSGPWLATTDVWILVSSSLPLAKVPKVTFAPVCASNAVDTSLNHCCCCAPYLPSTPMRTVSVWPAPFIEGPGLLEMPGLFVEALGLEAFGLLVAVDPPHAVTTSAVIAKAAVSVANLVFLVSMLFFLLG